MVNSSHASLPKSEMIEKGAKLETESCTKMDSSKRDVTLCVCVCVCVKFKVLHALHCFIVTSIKRINSAPDDTIEMSKPVF
jgi:hypothetical protein